MSAAGNNVLVVASCAKGIGITVFAGSELIYFAVKTLQSPRTTYHVGQQTSETIKAIIQEFAPGLIVVKSSAGQQAESKNRKAVAEHVKKEAEGAGIPLEEISFQAVKEKICGDSKPTKANTFKALSFVYTELRRFVNHPSLWQREYYDPLLSAAATGFYYQNKAARCN